LYTPGILESLQQCGQRRVVNIGKMQLRSQLVQVSRRIMEKQLFSIPDFDQAEVGALPFHEPTILD
jgi:hypothetical protein